MAIPDLQVFWDRECSKPFNANANLGEYDVALGATHIIYVKNPNRYVKAVFSGEITKRDKRASLQLPKEILPGRVEPITINLAAIEFTADVDEKTYFTDIDDLVTLPFKWVKA